ncbi:serpin family protein [Natranaeroarchaeum sulfidigenes]|uniref:Serine protease inhibitor n=1 Tax=Natranaeroarchaeum sulfidigenes TaxID=2784880 RepID=A0A897MUZ4_9EURY|nr:serpin family protein [Natranaeroarchaeum sulfidigenes]QSG01996.1 Serine protease inhibitor [Natranaeroarchaeum sulfidigenes]
MTRERMTPARGRREVLALAGAVQGALLAGCLDGLDSPGGGMGGSIDDLPTQDLDQLVAGNDQFALDALVELIEDTPEENLFFSPYSIRAALAMTWAGARDDTETAMADALAFALDQDEQHAAFADLDAELDARSDAQDNNDGEPFTLRAVNDVWGREEYPYRDEFLDTLDEHYGAELRSVPFETDPGAARTEINEYIAEQTEDRIDELLPQNAVDASTVLVLTNAIYFHASWLHQFNEGATEPAEFTALDGETGEVEMMSQEQRFPYAEVDGHQLVDLPYVGNEVSMIVILPAEGEFEAFEEALDPATLGGLLGELSTIQGTIELPRFEYESSFALKEVLSALGMEVAFDLGSADFSGIVEDGGLAISDVWHDAFVSVDEEGTEAAAATAVGMEESAPQDTFEMTVDRPFLFCIRDRPTETLLFVGRVVDAAAAQ